jgi:hypothetical protein
MNFSHLYCVLVAIPILMNGMNRAELLRYAACPDISDPKIENKNPAICVLSSLLHAS